MSGAPIGQQSHCGEDGKAMFDGEFAASVTVEQQEGTRTCHQGSSREGGCQCGTVSCLGFPNIILLALTSQSLP